MVIADGARSQLRGFMASKIKVTPYDWGALWAIGRDHEHHFSNVLEQTYKYTEVMAGILPMGYDAQQLLVSFFGVFISPVLILGERHHLTNGKHRCWAFGRNYLAF